MYISCKENFYKLNGTNNCYDKSILNDSYYFKDNMYFHCDENCLNCTEGKNKGIPIVVLIKYGHGNGKGGQVPPNDFITPAMKPIFDKIANDAWEEVKSS